MSDVIEAMAKALLARDELDEALLATIVTALLVREGGSVVLSGEEWSSALDRAGTMFCHRDGAGAPVLIALMPQTEGRA